MKFKKTKFKNAWQFLPHTNKGQPDFVQVQQALGGVRAIVRPPAQEGGVQNVMLHLAPGDWLIGLQDGSYFQLNAHAAASLLDQTAPTATDLPRPGVQ